MASADLVSGYLLRETPQPFRLLALLRKGQAAGGPDGKFWGLGVHPRDRAKSRRVSPVRGRRHCRRDGHGGVAGRRRQGGPASADRPES